MDEPDSVLSVEHVLMLPMDEALSRMERPDAPAKLLNDLIAELPALGDRAGRAVILAAATLKAKQGAGPALELLDREIPQLQRIPETLLEPAELDIAQIVLTDAFTGLERNLERKSLRAFVEIGRVLARLSRLNGEPAATPEFLSRVLVGCEQLKDDQGQILIYMELGQYLSQEGDKAGAMDNLAYAANLFQRCENARPEFGLHLSNRLVELSYDLWSEGRGSQSAAQALKWVTEFRPELPEGWFMLGTLLSNLERFDEAAEAYTTLTKLEPDNPSAHTNLAAMLMHLGNEDEAALVALDRSLKLAPLEVQPLLMRGQLRGTSNDRNGSVADLGQVLDLLEADLPPDDRSSVPAIRRYRQHREMRSSAYNALVQIHWACADSKDLRVIADRLINTGDAAFMAMGHRLSGSLAGVDKDWESARREYDAAISERDEPESRLARARLAIHLGDIDGAIADLAHLAPRQVSPAHAIAGLTEAIARSPDQPLIKRWLGFAQYESSAFLDSDKTLAEYVESVPTDTEARKWLGLSLISSLPQFGDTPVRRLLDGIRELARAAGEGDPEARESLVWLLDRLIAEERFLVYASVSPSVANAMPGFVALCSDWLSANDALRLDRNYPARIEAFQRVVDGAARIGLVCFSLCNRGQIANQKLLSGDLQGAADEARTALGELEKIAFTARSPALNEAFQKSLGPGSEYKKEVGLELEHLHVYGYIMPRVDMVRTVTARALARCGDRDGALSVLGDISGLIEATGRVPIEESVAVAEVLNRAGRGEDALTLLDHAEALSSGDTERVSILMTRSTVLLKLGRLNDATSAMKSIAPSLNDANLWVAWLNLASAAQAAGHDAEALDMLSRFDVTQEARSSIDVFNYYHGRAAALRGVGRLKEAQQAAEEAIDTIEDLRATLKDMKLRASWTTHQQNLYAFAIQLAALNDDAGAAFDLVERSRSRQLLDEIAIGHVALDEEGRELEVRIKHELIKAELLADIAKSSGGGRPQPRLLARLRELDPTLDLTATGGEGAMEPQLGEVRRKVDHALEAMRADSDRRRLASAERLFGEVVGWSDMRHVIGRDA